MLMATPQKGKVAEAFRLPPSRHNGGWFFGFSGGMPPPLFPTLFPIRP